MNVPWNKLLRVLARIFSFAALARSTGEELPAEGRAVRFPKGTEIECPECHTILAVSQEDIRWGDRVRLKPWLGDAVKPQQALKCPECGAPYFQRQPDGSMKLHTSKGWM